MVPPEPYGMNIPSMTAYRRDRTISQNYLIFRWNYVAIMADIEKAFLMIRTCESDRDVLCFCGSSNPVLLHQMWFTFVSQDRCLDCVRHLPYWVLSLNIIFLILRNAA